jgi:hypothetical protein
LVRADHNLAAIDAVFDLLWVRKNALKLFRRIFVGGITARVVEKHQERDVAAL